MTASDSSLTYTEAEVTVTVTTTVALETEGPATEDQIREAFAEQVYDLLRDGVSTLGTTDAIVVLEQYDVEEGNQP